MSAQHFTTLMLRALGYKEGRAADSDFYYEQAVDNAVSVGLLPPAQASGVKAGFFRRDHSVLVAWYGLLSAYKGAGTTVADSLIEKGVITRAKLSQAKALVRARG